MGTEALDRVCIGLPSGVEVGEEDGVKFAGQLLVLRKNRQADELSASRVRVHHSNNLHTVIQGTNRRDLCDVGHTGKNDASKAAPTRGV